MPLLSPLLILTVNDIYAFVLENCGLVHIRLNSSTANSPDKALVYRATIAPLDQPAVARTDASDTPLRSACTVQRHHFKLPRIKQLVS